MAVKHDETHPSLFVRRLPRSFGFADGTNGDVARRGHDESGASVPSAKVTVTGSNLTRSATASNNGSYVVTGLPAGDYTVQASAPNLVLAEPATITLDIGIRTLTLQLRVAVTVTCTNSRGLHALRSLDINAPLPGTSVLPFGNSNPLFLMTSSGVYNQNQLAVNVNARVTREIFLTGSYTWNHAKSNTDGIRTVPANPYDYTGEYGPASNDVHHTVSVNGTIDTKWGIRLGSRLSIQSGAPFDITTGSDLYGTTLFNARPGIATDPSKPGLVPTQYGLLDPQSDAG